MAKHVPLSGKEDFINNFHNHFPWPTNAHYPEGIERHLRIMDGWDKTGREYIERIRNSLTEEEDFAEYLGEFSDRYLTKTASQFYEEIDGIVVELGLSQEVIQEKIEVSKQSNQLQVTQERDKYLLPIYKVLRQRGYNKFELWA